MKGGHRLLMSQVCSLVWRVSLSLLRVLKWIQYGSRKYRSATQTPGRIQTVESPNSGFQYSHAVDCGSLRWIHFCGSAQGSGIPHVNFPNLGTRRGQRGSLWRYSPAVLSTRQRSLLIDTSRPTTCPGMSWARSDVSFVEWV